MVTGGPQICFDINVEKLFFFGFTVTFDGSIRLLDRIFTEALYDPTSQEFKDMEQDFCQTVGTRTDSSF